MGCVHPESISVRTEQVPPHMRPRREIGVPFALPMECLLGQCAQDEPGGNAHGGPAQDAGHGENGHVHDCDAAGEQCGDAGELPPTVEKAPLRTASAMTAHDSSPPAREKTSICRLANSSVEAMTLMNMRKRPAFAPRRLSAMRITMLPRPSLTPGTVTGRGMSSSR